jgi:hypothetical protein
MVVVKLSQDFARLHPGLFSAPHGRSAAEAAWIALSKYERFFGAAKAVP